MKTQFNLVAIAPVIFASILLSGCSGHPGAGHWQAASTDAPLYSALELEFDGKGTLHPTTPNGQSNKADLWCIWQAKSSQILDVQCGDENHRDTKLKFELRVTVEEEGAATNSKAVLSQDGAPVAQFERKR